MSIIGTKIGMPSSIRISDAAGLQWSYQGGEKKSEAGCGGNGGHTPEEKCPSHHGVLGVRIKVRQLTELCFHTRDTVLARLQDIVYIGQGFIGDLPSGQPKGV